MCKAQHVVLSITACLTMMASAAALAGKDNDDTQAEKARRPTLVLRVDRNAG